MGSRLTVVIVEYQCMDAVAGCVASLVAHLRGLEWDCLVISNSRYSQEGLEAHRGRLPEARLVSTGENRGYAHAVNAGLALTPAPYVLILNPDAILTDRGMGRLLEIMDSNPDLGAIGPRVLDPGGHVQPSCRRWPRPWTYLLVRTPLRSFGWAKRERRRYLMEDFSHEDAEDVDWISGGAMLVRREAIEEVGGMDDRYFLYMEDVDLCRRLWERGWRVRYQPDAQVQHAGQHESIKLVRSSVGSMHTRQHLASVVKYFFKFAFRTRRCRRAGDPAA